jgi:hypothetical protein
MLCQSDDRDYVFPFLLLCAKLQHEHEHEHEHEHRAPCSVAALIPFLPSFLDSQPTMAIMGRDMTPTPQPRSLARTDAS